MSSRRSGSAGSGRTWAALVALASGPVPAWGAIAGTDPGVPRTLLSERLDARAVGLVRLEARGATALDASGLPRLTPAQGLLGVAPEGFLIVEASPDDAPARPSAGGWLVLADGQTFPGELGPSGQDDDTLRWISPSLGELTVDVDLVTRVVLRDGPLGPAPAPGEQDTLLLANGDRLDGFVSRLGPTLTIESDGRETTLPAERVAEVRLANPPRAPEGTLAWLRDGTVARVRLGVTAGDGTATLRAQAGDAGDRPGTEDGETGSAVVLSDVLGLVFDAARVRPLSGSRVLEFAPGPGRAWTEPPTLIGEAPAPLGARDLLLPGPMRAVLELPDGASRLACVVELPAAMWAWGDCVLIVGVRAGPGGPVREVAREVLRGDRPAAAINVALPGGDGRGLVLVVEEGGFGPIQDRVVVRSGLLLMDGAQ